MLISLTVLKHGGIHRTSNHGLNEHSRGYVLRFRLIFHHGVNQNPTP